MKKVFLVLLVLVCSIAYTENSNKLLLGKWNIQFIVKNKITVEAVGIFNNSTFEYKIKSNKNEGLINYSFDCIYLLDFDVPQITLDAFPLPAKTFKLEKINKNELYLTDIENNNLKIRLTR